jgi:hypothetical protein
MEVYDRIAGQIAAVGLPLFAVTLTALPRANTPVLLMLHWHGFAREAPGRLPASVAGSALQINEHWSGLGNLDDAMLDAAWRLGAWQLEREEKGACSALGAAPHEALECRRAFGELVPGGDATLDEAPDRADMLDLAAGIGYVRWLFRPVRGGVWKDAAQDDSLSADGGREPPCPVPARAPVGSRVSHTRYRLGRLNRLVLP